MADYAPALFTYPDDDDERNQAPKVPSEFEKAAAESEARACSSEFWSFLAQNKKWWLLPIVIVMLLLGTLIFLSEHRSDTVYLHAVLNRLDLSRYSLWPCPGWRRPPRPWRSPRGRQGSSVGDGLSSSSSS